MLEKNAPKSSPKGSPFDQILYDAVSGHVESLSWSVIKNLTLHRVRKIFFSFYHHKVEIRSFPTMYNTWGCSLGRNGPKK